MLWVQPGWRWCGSDGSIIVGSWYPPGLGTGLRDEKWPPACNHDPRELGGTWFMSHAVWIKWTSSSDDGCLRGWGNASIPVQGLPGRL